MSNEGTKLSKAMWENSPRYSMDWRWADRQGECHHSLAHLVWGYGRNRGQGLIRVLTLGVAFFAEHICAKVVLVKSWHVFRLRKLAQSLRLSSDLPLVHGIFLERFCVKRLLRNVATCFDCAGSHKMCVCTIWTDVKLLLLSVFICISLANRQGAVNLIPSTAQRRWWFEIVISGLIIPTYLHMFTSLLWRGAKPRTPTTAFGFLDSFSFLHLVYVVFRYHGKGLSREPWHHNPYWPFGFRDLLDGCSGHECLFGVHPLFRMFFFWLLFSWLVCMFQDSVPDGSLKRSSFV